MGLKWQQLMSILNDHFYFKVIYPFKFEECYSLVVLCVLRVWRDGSETERERERERERVRGGWSECNTEEVKWFSNDWGLKSDRTPSRKPPRDVFLLAGRGLTSPGILPESHPLLHTFFCQSLGVSKMKELYTCAFWFNGDINHYSHYKLAALEEINKNYLFVHTHTHKCMGLKWQQLMSILNDHFYFKVIYPFKFEECYSLVVLCVLRVWRDGSETEREREKRERESERGMEWM